MGIVASAFVIIYSAFIAQEMTMPDRNEWEERAANLLKAELKKRGITYAQLVDKLADLGVSENERNVRNKLSRGKFTAAFMLQCLTAIGVSSLALE